MKLTSPRFSIKIEQERFDFDLDWTHVLAAFGVMKKNFGDLAQKDRAVYEKLRRSKFYITCQRRSRLNGDFNASSSPFFPFHCAQFSPSCDSERRRIFDACEQVEGCQMDRIPGLSCDELHR